MEKRRQITLIMCFIASVLFFNIRSSEPAALQKDISVPVNQSVTQNTPSKHFAWGVELGTSIDVTGYDSSTINADAIFGYKNDLIHLLGLGVGIHRAMGSGDNYVPVYLTFRSSFTKKPKLFFMSLKAGYSFNTIGDANTFGDINASLGLGINLAVRQKFRSYLILAYEFRHFNEKHRDAIEIDDPNISMASLTLGFNF